MTFFMIGPFMGLSITTDQRHVIRIQKPKTCMTASKALQTTTNYYKMIHTAFDINFLESATYYLESSIYNAEYLKKKISNTRNVHVFSWLLFLRNFALADRGP